MRWIWIAVLAVTVLAGVLRAGPALHPNPYQSADERSYVHVAVRVAETGRYGQESLHWPPGAPMAFAAAARVGGHTRDDIPAAYGVQWLAGTALVPLVFALGLLLGGRVAGLTAAAIVATYPPLIAVTGDLLSEPLGALWLTAAFVALAAARRSDRTSRAARGVRAALPPRAGTLVAAGALMAAAILTRANLLVVLPAVAIALGPRRGALFAAAALVPIAAWSLNASSGSGTFVPVSAGGGTSLFVGTFLPGGGTLPGAKRALKAETLRFAPRLRRVKHARELPGETVMAAVAARRPGLRFDAALRAEAWRNVTTYPREDPAGFAKMIAAKLPRMWLRPSPRSDALRGTPLRLWHLAIVLIVIVGLVRKPDRVILAALLAFTAFHLVVPAMPRYALPLLGALIAAGCAGWRAPRRRPALPDWPASRARRLARRASPSRSA